MTTTTRQTAPAPSALFAKVDTDTWSANATKARAADLTPCTHCGRGVAEGKGYDTVVIDGGDALIHPDALTDADLTDPGFMGAWTLGPTCGRLVPAAVRRARTAAPAPVEVTPVAETPAPARARRTWDPTTSDTHTCAGACGEVLPAQRFPTTAAGLRGVVCRKDSAAARAARAA